MPPLEKKNCELAWMAVEVTGGCNLDCVHCRCRDFKGLDLSKENLFRLLDEAAEFAKPVVVLSGGEPLLRDDVFEIARHGADRGLRMALATNGTLMTRAVAGRIEDSGIKIVSLSLDGATRAVHDDFRRAPGAFDAAVRAAHILKDAGIPFIINSSFTKKNQAQIKHTYRLAKTLGAKAWYMFMVVPTGRAEGAADELIDAETYDEILEWHYDAEKDECDMLMRPTCAPHYYRIIAEKNRGSGDPLERRSLSFSPGGAKGCVAAQKICFVDHEGFVYPCSYFHVPAGNFLETPFREIWEDSELFNNLRDYSKYTGDCGICEYRNVCGGCRVRAQAASGDYLAKDPLCRFVPARAGTCED